MYSGFILLEHSFPALATASAYLAIRLIRITGMNRAWIVIAVAMLAMAIRRLTVLVGLLASPLDPNILQPRRLLERGDRPAQRDPVAGRHRRHRSPVSHDPRGQRNHATSPRLLGGGGAAADGRSGGRQREAASGICPEGQGRGGPPRRASPSPPGAGDVRTRPAAIGLRDSRRFRPTSDGGPHEPASQPLRLCNQPGQGPRERSARAAIAAGEHFPGAVADQRTAVRRPGG